MYIIDHQPPTLINRMAHKRELRRMAEDVIPRTGLKTALMCIAACAVALGLMAATALAFAEEAPLTVTASELNGRAGPSAKSSVEARFFQGETLHPLAMSGEWVEVAGGETGTVWANARYLTEREPFTATNVSGGYVNIRDAPDGSKCGRIKKGRQVTVERLVCGWGYIGTGWVDMAYFEAKE